MATILIDNFNSYNDGDLNGQGDWFGSTTFDVQGDVVQEGAKAVKNVGTGTEIIEKIGNQLAEGGIGCRMRITANNSAYAYFGIKENTLQCALINFDKDGNIYAYFGGEYYPSIGTYNANQWYFVQIQWRSSPSHQVRYKVDDGEWTDWGTPYQDWTTGPDRVLLQIINQVEGSTCYWDNINDISIIPISVSDLGEGVDIVGIKGAVPVADQGNGGEVLAIKNQLSILESGSGIDVIQKEILYLPPFRNKSIKPQTSFTKEVKPLEGFAKQAKPSDGFTKQPQP